MSWVIIGTGATSRQMISVADSLLSEMDLKASSAFYNFGNMVNNSAESEVQIAAGAEGLGYSLNQCIDASSRFDENAEWFLVLGSGLATELNRQEIRRAIEMATSTKLPVLSYGGSGDLKLSTGESIALLAARRCHMVSHNAGGFLIIPKTVWQNTTGFREDIGTWGVELHFACDVLSGGGQILAVPWSASSGRKVGDECARVLSALVAYASYGRDQSLANKFNFWRRLGVYGSLSHMKTLTVAFRKAHDVLRTRSFLRSGG